jgi:hypothetical protein
MVETLADPGCLLPSDHAGRRKVAFRPVRPIPRVLGGEDGDAPPGTIRPENVRIRRVTV